MSETSSLAERFRGFYPVIIDVETGGFNAETDALLEIAAVTLKMSDDGIIELDQSISHKIEPFEGANIEAAALNFTGIDLEDPDRGAVAESESINEIFKLVRTGIKESGCTRAILVGHNAVFDHNFLKAAVARCKIKRDPFHPFSCFDTVSLAGLAYGQTVLAKACAAADIDFDNAQAHSALYDTERTADLFCKIVNQWKTFGGWPV